MEIENGPYLTEINSTPVDIPHVLKQPSIKLKKQHTAFYNEQSNLSLRMPQVQKQSTLILRQRSNNRYQ